MVNSNDPIKKAIALSAKLTMDYKVKEYFNDFHALGMLLDPFIKDNMFYILGETKTIEVRKNINLYMFVKKFSHVRSKT